MACSEDKAVAEVLINQPAPPELYESFLAAPDKECIEGLLASDGFWEKVASIGPKSDPRETVRVQYSVGRRIITITAPDENLANRVAQTVVDFITSRDRKKRESLCRVIEDLEISQSDRVNDARRKFAIFVSPKMLVHPPAPRTGVEKMLFEQRTDQMEKEIEAETEILRDLRADHRRVRFLLMFYMNQRLSIAKPANDLFYD